MVITNISDKIKSVSLNANDTIQKYEITTLTQYRHQRPTTTNGTKKIPVVKCK